MYEEGTLGREDVAIAPVLEIADRLGIDVGFLARPIGADGPAIGHRENMLWPGASLYKTLGAVALCRLEGHALSTPVTVSPERRVPGGAGLSIMEDEVTLTWREIMRLMLVGSDNTAAAVVLDHVGEESVDAVARDAGMTATRIASSEETVRDAVHAARFDEYDETGAGTRTRDLDDDLVAFAREDHVLGSVTTATDQVRLMNALFSGSLLDGRGTKTIQAMLHQHLGTSRMTHALSYPGVRVASKTGTWGPFRHETAVVTHEGEPPIAVSVLTRSLDFDRLLPAVDDGIGEMTTVLIDAVRSRLPSR